MARAVGCFSSIVEVQTSFVCHLTLTLDNFIRMILRKMCCIKFNDTYNYKVME